MSSQRANLVAFIFSTSILVAHCVRYEDSSQASTYVDPSDMGSYSHSVQRNIITTNRRLQHDAQIDEVTEKRTIYHSQDKTFGADSGDGRSVAPDWTRANGGRVEVLEKNVKYRDSTTAVCGICPTVDEASVMVYTKRIVASLLRQMNVRNHIFGPNEAITIDLQAELSHEDFTKLNKFISNKSKAGVLPKDEIDTLAELMVVTDIVGNLLHYVYPEPVITWMEYVQEKINFQYLSSLKFWNNFGTISALTVLTLVLLRKACTSRHPLRVLFYIFMLFFTISCVSVFRDLYESARAENHARLHQYDRIPKDCSYNDFGMLDSIGYYVRVHFLRHKDQCVEYHKQMLGDTYYHVTPVEAFSETVSRLIFHPMEYIGEKSGKFFGGVVAMVPFWLQPILLVLVFVFGFLALFGYRITTPFISIEPAPAPAGGGGARFLEGSPQHQRAAAPRQGQAIIEKPAGDMVRTSTGIDVGTTTDDLEDYIKGKGVYDGHRERSHGCGALPSTRTWKTVTWTWTTWAWALFEEYFWIVYEIVAYYLNLILREVPVADELVLDDYGAFQHVERNPEPGFQAEDDLHQNEGARLEDQEGLLPKLVKMQNVTATASSSSTSSTSSSSRNTPIFDRPRPPPQSQSASLQSSSSHSSNEWVYVDEETGNGNEIEARKIQRSTSFDTDHPLPAGAGDDARPKIFEGPPFSPLPGMGSRDFGPEPEEQEETPMPKFKDKKKGTSPLGRRQDSSHGQGDREGRRKSSSKRD